MRDPYTDWLEEESRDREDAFSQLRHSQILELGDRRLRMTLLERHRQTAEQAARLSTVPASSVERGRPGVDRGDLQQQQTFDFTDADRLIRLGIEMREQQLDEACGFGAMRQIDQMLAEEKDRMILDELVRFTPAQIEVFFQGKLGSAETIRRLRRNNKLRSKDGMPVEPKPGVDSPNVDS